MAAKTGRRRVRKRKHNNENYGMKLKVFIGIIILAVFLGFLTARFVIGPIIGYNADESPVGQADDGGNTEDAQAASGKDTGAEEDGSSDSSTGYALQFGAFSKEESARELADMLSEKGIKVQVVETDQVFKVIGQPDESKEAVLEELEKVKEKDIEDVFVASLG